MSISTFLLALTLIIWGMIGLAWLPFSMDVVHVLALITGFMIILEGLNIVSYRLPAGRN